MDFVRGEARGRADGVVVGVFDMKKVDVPVVLMFATNHGEHLCHCMVNAFDAAVTARVVGAGREFANAKKLIYGSCQLGTELRSIVGQEGGRESPDRDVRFTKTLAVPSAMNSAAVTANISARRLKRSAKRRI